MDEYIKEYSEAIKAFIEISQEETKIKVKVMAARARVRTAKDQLRMKEEEMLELTY